MTSRNLLQSSTDFFQSIAQVDRPAYRKNILTIKQLPGDQPVFYHKQYPTSDVFIHNGYRLHYHYLQQTPHPSAIVFFFHGMYCHGGQSGYLADVIASHNKSVNIYALDFMNAGLSEGDCPGYYTVEGLEKQALAFVQYIENMFLKEGQGRRPKLFLMGESMGGLVTFKLCVNHPEKWTGAVMFAPALRDCSENIPVLKQLGRIMGCLCPTFKLVPQDYIGFTKYQNFQHMKTQKGRYLGPHPPGTAYSILKEMDTCHLLFPKMSTPYLLIQGGVDSSVDLFAPLDLEREAVVKDKTTLYYKNVWHDVLVEEEVREVAGVVGQWLRERV